ncbi:MAG: NUDIX domain-containing protein [Hyphomicrobiaceae bacterium]
MIDNWLVKKSLQTYWRLTRPLTMGVQGVVIDDDGRVLLVRHTYRPGWHFPGGGVEKRETVVTALQRELHEETGVQAIGPPQLFGLYANFTAFPSDHIALFVIRDWQRPVVPKPNAEIAEHGFFARNDLPEATISSVSRRLAEILDQHQPDENW